MAIVGHIISLSYVNDTSCALSLPRAFHLMPCTRKMELNYNPAEFIWISIITVLASSSHDILRMYYLTP